jgi:hypothetical protein
MESVQMLSKHILIRYLGILVEPELDVVSEAEVEDANVLNEDINVKLLILLKPN